MSSSTLSYWKTCIFLTALAGGILTELELPVYVYLASYVYLATIRSLPGAGPDNNK